MEANRDERLEQAVATLDNLIDQMDACGLPQSMFFLEMAKLQVKLDLNGITDAEFNALCDALERGTLESATRVRPGQPRARTGCDLRGLGRGRPYANDIAMRRVGRRS